MLKLKDKHLASLRCIVEEPQHCVCGKPVTDPVHYSCIEIRGKTFITNELGYMIIKKEVPIHE